MTWLIEQSVAEAMKRAMDGGLQPSAHQQSAYVAKCEAEKELRDGSPRSLRIAGNVAEVRVEGTLTERPSLLALIFGDGNTTYQDIRGAISEAETDPEVTHIRIVINSPGGEADGLFETLAAIEASTKPKSVLAHKAASAAYAIAAVSGKITAATMASEFGSIGVAAKYLTPEDLIWVTSTEAPDKRPDPRTEEGRAAIRKQLDDVHEVFADAIARGRGKTVQEVNETFGRGAVVLAKEAKKVGMIDRLPTQASPRTRATVRTEAPAAALTDSPGADPTPDAVPEASPPDQPPAPAREPNASAASGGAQPQPRRNKMTEEELRAQHPELHAAMLAKGEEQGIAKERKRCLAHRKMAKSTGAVEAADKAMESGASVLDEDVHAEYMSAAMNRREQADRQAETDAAAGATANTETDDTNEKDPVDATADAMDRLFGKVSE